MARGYLGKISAIVTANTGDYVRKLNESAGETRNFAKTVESTLRAASRDAAKSIQGIYTPLQQFERALRAASSQRLSFKGFDGAINTVEQLKQRLGTIRDTDIDVVVKASGLNTITDLRLAIKDISQADIDLFRNVGGMPGLQKLRADIEATRDAAGNITVKPRVNPAELDRLISQFSVIDDRQISVTMEVLGQRELDATVTKMRQLRDVADQIERPLAAATEKFGQLSQPVQGAFIPALARAQSAVEAVRSEIESGVPVSRRRFEELAAAVGLTTKAIDELRVAQAAVSRIRTGQEFEFQQPAAEAALMAAGAVDPTKLPAGARAANQKQFSDAQAAIRREAEELERLIAVRKAAEAAGASRGTLAVLQAQIDSKVKLLDQERRAYERLISTVKNASDAERDRLADRIGASSPMDRNAGNIGASTSIRGMESLGGRLVGQRTDISGMGQSTPFFPGNGRTNPTGSFGPELPPSFGGRGDAGLGRGLDDPLRQIDRLREKVVAAKAAVEKLPEPLRSQFIPAIQQSEDELRTIAASGEASADKLRDTAAAADAITKSAGRVVAQAQAIEGISEKFEDFSAALKTSALRSFTAELDVMQRAAVNVGSEFRGPLVAAMNSYRKAASDALNSNTFEDPKTVGQLKKLREEFIKAATQAGLSSVEINGALKRAGDVGRGGFDKFSLALNQAAFAIDDFFSSTGGLEFKLRAVSNNITQLAFILGGTTGLFVGLGAVIGGQVAVAITKFINGGKTAEDQTKALNDALARQKSLVEELKQAFQSLGDTLTRKAFSPAAQQANEFRREIEEIIKKQKELREARLSDVDPTVQRERATQGSLQRRLDTETDIGRRVALQQQIEESRRREREAARASAAAPAANGAQAAVAIERAGQALFDQRTRGEDTVTPRDTAVLEAARARAGNAARGGGPQAIRDALIQQRDALFASGAAETDAAVAESLRELEALIRSLENPIRRAVDALAVSVLEGAQKTADALARAQQSIVDAGVPQSRIAREADAVARNLKEIADQITPEADEATIAALKQQEEALRKNAAALESAARSVELFSAGLDRNSRQLSDTVLQEADSREMQARRNLNAAAGSVFLDRGIANGSISSLSGGVAPSLRANGVRNRERRFEEAQEDRRRARAELARRRSVQQEFELTRSSAVRQFEEDALSGNMGDQAKKLIEQRDKARAAIEGGGLDAGQMATQERNLAQAMAGLAVIFAESPIAASLELFSNQIDAAAQRAAEVTRRIEEERASVSRGEELSKTPGQAAREELDQQLQDIRNFFNQAAEESTGLPEDVAEIRGKMEEALNRTTEDAKRSVAPAVFALQDAVQNAILQGPSRAALNAADVTTMEGSRELNRLLRGDDPAKDVNLLELQKQTKLLEDLVEREPPPII